jgi:parvulin-like peptidyl-prolyl isomerase
MDLRFFLGFALTTIGGLLTAQAPVPAPAKPAAPPAAQGQGTPPVKLEPAKDPAKQDPAKQDPAKQDPDRPGKKPADEIAELQREQERLQKEIAFVREQVAMSNRLLSDKFASRKLQVTGIDAGTSAVSAPIVATQMKRARVMTDEEKRANTDAVLLIDSQPVKEAALDELVAYLKTQPAQAPDEKAAYQRVTLEVIRVTSILGAVGDSIREAQKQVAEAKEKLAKGTPFAEVAKTFNHGPGLPEDGKFTLTHSSRFGLALESVAFGAKEGTMLPPIPTMDGFVIAQVDKIVAGEAPSLEVHLIVIPYLSDPKEMEQARTRAALGRVDVAVRDEKMYERLPPFLQPLPMAAVDTAKGEDAPKAPKVDSPDDKPKEGAKKDPPKSDAVKKEPVKATPPAGGGHQV